MNVPSLYKCSKCGAMAMSPTDGATLKVRDKLTNQLVTQDCQCGGAFVCRGPLFVVKFRDAATVKIRCVPCGGLFRRVTPHRFACMSCSNVALVQGRELWLMNDQIKTEGV